MNIFKATNASMTTANVIALASVISAPVVGYFLTPQWSYVIVALVLWQFINVVGISAGVHRYFSHKAFACSRAWQWVMATTAMVGLVGPPCIWAEAHVKHHQYSDKDKDPYLRFALNGESAIHHTTTIGKRFLLKKIAEDNLHHLTLKYYWLYVIGYVVTLAVLALVLSANPLTYIFWFWLVPTGLSQLTLRFILWTGHIPSLGYRNFETKDYSNNWWFAALIGAGEGWHNNHHQYPYAAKVGIKWWEFDPGWWFIRAIRQ